MTLTIAAAALLTLTGKQPEAAPRDYKDSYRYAHRAAVKYRQQRDHLQQLLTLRVRENAKLRQRIVSARDAVRHRPDVVEAIRLAAKAYHVDFGQLLRIAQCESVLNPYAKNRHSSASGLLQFMPSTWRSTPYAAESIWSPYASALAGAWMISHGRRSEWVC